MEQHLKSNAGIKVLLKQAKQKFRIPENLNHYSKDDYKRAEKKFVKECVLKGKWQ